MNEAIDYRKKFQNMSNKQLYLYFKEASETGKFNMFSLLEGMKRVLHPHGVKTLDFDDDITYLD